MVDDGAMTTGRLRVLAALTLLLVLAGCARPGAQAAEGGTPEGPVRPSATAPGSPEPSPTWEGADVPPNHAGNNSWKQRADLTPEDRALAETAADRIRPALEAQRARNDFGLATTRATLLGLGFAADRVQVTAMRDPAVAGAVFALRVGAKGCVVGDVRPERLLVEVTGAAAEFGCLEPFSH
jgi:hypothetical protein